MVDVVHQDGSGFQLLKVHGKNELKSTGRVVLSLCLPVALLIVSERTGGVVDHTGASILGHSSAQRGTSD